MIRSCPSPFIVNSICMWWFQQSTIIVSKATSWGFLKINVQCHCFHCQSVWGWGSESERDDWLIKIQCCTVIASLLHSTHMYRDRHAWWVGGRTSAGQEIDSPAYCIINDAEYAYYYAITSPYPLRDPLWPYLATDGGTWRWGHHSFLAAHINIIILAQAHMQTVHLGIY